MIKKILIVILFVCACTFVVFKQDCAVSKPKWKYIVIHHSGTKKGNAKKFDAYHRKVRHMKNGIAYHYVINNGTSGTGNGEIEITHRWKKQLPGGHCRKEWNNKVGIGICLVGNFQKSRPTNSQYWSLVWLVKKLMREYNIKPENVRGHKSMWKEQTICPGKYFPWTKFKNELSKNKKRN